MSFRGVDTFLVCINFETSILLISFWPSLILSAITLKRLKSQWTLLIWSSCGSYELLKVLDKEKYRVAYYYIFNTLLFSLLVLHVYWWVLMYRMLVKQIQARGQLSEDVRSGKSDWKIFCILSWECLHIKTIFWGFLNSLMEWPCTCAISSAYHVFSMEIDLYICIYSELTWIVVEDTCKILN